jgi:imidazole glycerol phosphate synthase subunit HisF
VTLKTRLIPCLDVKDASHARSGAVAKTGKCKMEAVR